MSYAPSIPAAKPPHLTAPQASTSTAETPASRPAPGFEPQRHQTHTRRTSVTPSTPVCADDLPYDNLSPEAYARAADLLCSLERQPAGDACRRRAADYAAMTLAQVQSAVRAALHAKALSARHLGRAVQSLWYRVSPNEEAVIAIRELCRRGGDPALLGYAATPTAASRTC